MKWALLTKSHLESEKFAAVAAAAALAAGKAVDVVARLALATRQIRAGLVPRGGDDARSLRAIRAPTIAESAKLRVCLGVCSQRLSLGVPIAQKFGHQLRPSIAGHHGFQGGVRGMRGPCAEPDRHDEAEPQYAPSDKIRRRVLAAQRKEPQKIWNRSAQAPNIVSSQDGIGLTFERAA